MSDPLDYPTAGSAEAGAPASPSPRADVAIAAIGGVRFSREQVARARDILTRIYALRRAANLYPAEHPATAESVRFLGDSIRRYHAEGVEPQFTFFEGEIFLGEQLLSRESLVFDQLVRDMTAIGVGSLTFRRGMTDDELVRLTPILNADSGEIARVGGITKMAADARLGHVQMSAVRAFEEVAASVGGTREAALAVFGNAVSLIREVDRLLRSNRHISAAKVTSVADALVDNVLTNREAMLQLSGLKDYDEYTYYHSANVAVLSLALGAAVTDDRRFLSSLGIGALLHDVGKLSMGRDILAKEGPLSEAEWEVVYQHPVIGAEMVALMQGVDKSAIVTILEHHMRWDGEGYPAHESLRRQHLTSRIVAVADSYDAMTSSRVYSDPIVHDKAMEHLAESSGTALDPRLVRLFVGLMGVYPPRSVVQLSTGATGVVLAPGVNDPFLPTVRVFADADGTLIAPEDIALESAGGISVKGCLDPRRLNIEVDDYL
ncbi:MAG: HD domain-containing protein [Coriobacteriia bacterium]|nr:HD domain-containing protein [Coriobacteriia bacterium]